MVAAGRHGGSKVVAPGLPRCRLRRGRQRLGHSSAGRCRPIDRSSGGREALRPDPRAWHGAWCGYKIVAGLEEVGQRATALDLPSGGIDGSPPDTVTLEAQADRVIALLDSLSEPVVLV